MGLARRNSLKMWLHQELQVYKASYDLLKNVFSRKNEIPTNTNEPSAEQCGRFPEAGIHQTCK